jgi:hypothetical protein
MNIDAKRNKLPWVVLEMFLLGLSFFILIPPISSEAVHQKPPYWPDGIYALIPFIGAQAMAVRRGAEVWPIVIVKVIGFFVFGWAIHERCF